MILFLASDIFKLTALANSARRIWYGVDMTGTVVKGENCPIEVEDEQLTFDISEFPNSYYEKKGDFLKYNGKVTAKYTFYNPADYKVTAKLVFPFGYYPEYGPDEYDEKNQVYKRIDDTAKFDIKINDKEIKKNLRHSLYNSDYDFDIYKEMSLLSDGYIKDDFYSPELPVTKYVYEISGVDKKLYNREVAEIEIPAFDGKRRYYLEQSSYGFTTNDKGNTRIGVGAENGEEVEFYVIGEPVKDLPKWKFYESSSNESKEIKGEMKLKSTSKMTFKEFALAKLDKNLNVNINTPFFMTENNQSGFTKTQKGYHFKSNGLPEGELRFSLSTVEKPERKSNIGTFYILGMLMFGLLQILPIIVGVVAVVVLVAIWVRKRRR